MKNVITVDPQSPEPDAIEHAARLLRSGGLVAFPTETVYGLGAHALDTAAVEKIFTAKERPGWDPLIVHVADTAAARSLAKNLPPLFETLAQRFWPGPLTLVVGKAAHVPDEVTAGRSTIALRQPRHPVAAALLAAARLPVAAPSANRFGRPSPTRAEHVLEDLAGRVDLVLDAGPTPLGVESTVLDLTQSPPAILRPGGVSREALEAVIGAVGLSAGVADEVAAQGLAGPGMTAKHYAPRARVELFGNEDELRACAGALEGQGRRVGIVDGTGGVDRLANTLFAQLRALDARGVDVIVCVLPPADGMGLAIRDRLRRAAGLGDKTP